MKKILLLILLLAIIPSVIATFNVSNVNIPSQPFFANQTTVSGGYYWNADSGEVDNSWFFWYMNGVLLKWEKNLTNYKWASGNVIPEPGSIDTQYDGAIYYSAYRDATRPSDFFDHNLTTYFNHTLIGIPTWGLFDSAAGIGRFNVSSQASSISLVLEYECSNATNPGGMMTVLIDYYNWSKSAYQSITCVESSPATVCYGNSGTYLLPGFGNRGASYLDGILSWNNNCSRTIGTISIPLSARNSSTGAVDIAISLHDYGLNDGMPNASAAEGNYSLKIYEAYLNVTYPNTSISSVFSANDSITFGVMPNSGWSNGTQVNSTSWIYPYAPVVRQNGFSYFNNSMNTSGTTTFNLSVSHSNSQSVGYNFSSTMNSTCFNVSFSTSTVQVVGTGTNWTNVTLETNSSCAEGLYSGTIDVADTYFNNKTTLAVTINVSNSYTDIEVYDAANISVRPITWTCTGVDGTICEKSFTIYNIGAGPCVDGTLTSTSSADIGYSYTPYDVDASDSQTYTFKASPNAGSYNEYVDFYCSGSHFYDVELNFNIISIPGDATIGGGSGAVSCEANMTYDTHTGKCVPRINILPAVFNVTPSRLNPAVLGKYSCLSKKSYAELIVKADKFLKSAEIIEASSNNIEAVIIENTTVGVQIWLDKDNYVSRKYSGKVRITDVDGKVVYVPTEMVVWNACSFIPLPAVKVSFSGGHFLRVTNGYLTGLYAWWIVCLIIIAVLLLIAFWYKLETWWNNRKKKR